MLSSTRHYACFNRFFYFLSHSSLLIFRRKRCFSTAFDFALQHAAPRRRACFVCSRFAECLYARLMTTPSFFIITLFADDDYFLQPTRALWRSVTVAAADAQR